MIGLIFTLMFGFCSGIFIYIYNVELSEGYKVIMVFSIIVFIISFIVTVINHFTFIENYFNNIVSINKNKKDKEIYEDQAKDLLDEFKLYLADIYPNIEKSIFESMKPEKVTAYMIKYPELKSSETIIELTNLINKYKSKSYKCLTDITEAEQNLEFMDKAKYWKCIYFLTNL